MNNSELLKRFEEIISPELKNLRTNWTDVYFICTAFDRNMTGIRIKIKPLGEGEKGWFSKSAKDSLHDLLDEWQSGASGPGERGMALIARVDRRDLEVRFFYGDDAEEWNGVSRELFDAAEALFVSDE